MVVRCRSRAGWLAPAGQWSMVNWRTSPPILIQKLNSPEDNQSLFRTPRRTIWIACSGPILPLPSKGLCACDRPASARLPRSNIASRLVAASKVRWRGRPPVYTHTRYRNAVAATSSPSWLQAGEMQSSLLEYVTSSFASQTIPLHIISVHSAQHGCSSLLCITRNSPLPVLFRAALLFLDTHRCYCLFFEAG